MHLMRPAIDDLARRLEQLERVLQDSRATLRVTDGEDAALDRAAPRVAATLARIKSLTALVQSSLVRSEPDAIDLLTTQLLLSDYALVVQELRASTSGAASTLKEAATVVAETERVLRADAKRRD
jgi:ABC-type transporter Mla subunit MlaD